MKIISRKDALAAGEKFYFTGKPCGKGHVSTRYVVSTHCVACNAEKSKQWVKDNPEKRREHARNAARKWRKLNPELARKTNLEQALKWAKRNPEKVNARNQRRRAAQRNALPKWFDEFDELVTSEAAALATFRAQKTGIAWDVDHMIPLTAESVCGLHVWENLQVIPELLNLQKNNKLRYTNRNEWLVDL